MSVTEQVNAEIRKLKTEIDRLPSGGGLEILRADLAEFRGQVDRLIDAIDMINVEPGRGTTHPWALCPGTESDPFVCSFMKKNAKTCIKRN